MTDTNWCYAMCDSLVLPIVSIITFALTVYQEWRHHHMKDAIDKA